jgi:hypothetical protein
VRGLRLISHGRIGPSVLGPLLGGSAGESEALRGGEVGAWDSELGPLPNLNILHKTLRAGYETSSGQSGLVFVRFPICL